ncbi:aconitate hydratase AcnA [soil metagenome]
MTTPAFDTLRTFDAGANRQARFHSLPELQRAGAGRIDRLPICIRMVLESVVRNCDGLRVTEQDIRDLAGWQPNAERTTEIPFVVARVLMPDSSGIPLLVDLAAMRDAAARLGANVNTVEPSTRVDLVVDHSVQVDSWGEVDSLKQNVTLEFQRNGERYNFLKWSGQAFNGVKVVPPGIGICHQVNLEYLAPGICEKDGVFYPDTLIGADSHTPMINGIGVVGWGAGGIEAEAAMLGQPVYLLTPDVVGVHLKGKLPVGVTATDAVLTVTEILRAQKVVGKFVEFFGEGATSLGATDRATIANMAAEYGATIGFFGVDDTTADYLYATGRPAEDVEAFRNYFKAQQMWGIPAAGECDYTSVLEIDLGTIVPSVAGPRRPQDRIALADLKQAVPAVLMAPVAEGGYAKSAAQLGETFRLENGTGRYEGLELRHGSIVLAALTSCTNTSNPTVVLAAGLLAKKAVDLGLRVAPWIKTSIGPGSRNVTVYLEKLGLQQALDTLGFRTIGYGCTTCIGNSGPLDPQIENLIVDNDIIAASVLSGNRNFEARIHPNLKASFLMSPPLVVAMAIAGRMDIDLASEPLGTSRDGRPVFLRDVWPSSEEIKALMSHALDRDTFQRLYGDLSSPDSPWDSIEGSSGPTFDWDPASYYIKEPPYFDGLTLKVPTVAPIVGARALAIFGDSVTTDHISPGGAIKADSPAGRYLQAAGITPRNFNTYIGRRSNHEVMMRGTFANVRIRNLMMPGTEGGVTRHQPDGEVQSIYDAAMAYQAAKVPTVVIAGKEYGTGSSRDWAAKGTQLLGVRAVVASSYERIHRSNLVFLGVLPCQFEAGTDASTLKLDGSETFSLPGLENGIQPRQVATLHIERADGSSVDVPVTLRVDTEMEVQYYLHGGIMQYMLRKILA